MVLSSYEDPKKELVASLDQQGSSHDFYQLFCHKRNVGDNSPVPWLGTAPYLSSRSHRHFPWTINVILGCCCLRTAVRLCSWCSAGQAYCLPWLRPKRGRNSWITSGPGSSVLTGTLSHFQTTTAERSPSLSSLYPSVLCAGAVTAHPVTVLFLQWCLWIVAQVLKPLRSSWA